MTKHNKQFSIQTFLLGLVALIQTFFVQSAYADKANLVLLPIETTDTISHLESDFGAALEEGLQQRYTVFYGAEVEKLLEKEYAKIDCTAESCNQALAVAFNGELIADASVKAVGGGYLLKLRITNVLTNQVVKTTSYPCKNCDEFDVISQLQSLGRNERNIKPAINQFPLTNTSAPLLKKPKERAVLVFDSNPTGAKVILNGDEVGKTPYQGLNHHVGDNLELELHYDGYKKVQDTIELTSSVNHLNVFQFEELVTLRNEDLDYRINDLINNGGLNDEVEFVSIYFPENSDLLDASAIKSLTKLGDFINSSSNVEILIQGYASERELNSPSDQLKLSENRVKVVKDNLKISNLNVTVDSISYGSRRYVSEERLTENQVVLITINFKDIIQHSFDSDLNESITKLDDFALEKGKAKITVLTEPFKPNMEVFVNGEAKGIAPLSLELDVGSHNIQAKSDQQNSKTKTIQLKDGDNQQVLLSFSSSSITPKKASKPISTTQRNSNAKSLDTVQSIIDTLVDIPAGSFMMGSNNGDKDEKPVHEVTVPEFKMMKHEVTQGQWEAVVGNNPAHFSSCGSDCPVEKVSWNDIQSFIKKLNQQTGMNFRLPSEAEWEYAARAEGFSFFSSASSKYGWGDDIDCSKARYGYYSNECGKQESPDSVGTYQPNDFGLYDMHGNVWEWTQDCWNNSYYIGGWSSSSAPDDGSAWESGDCNIRVLRGGSWDDDSINLRSANRYGYSTSNRYINSGFRLAHD